MVPIVEDAPGHRAGRVAPVITEQPQQLCVVLRACDDTFQCRHLGVESLGEGVVGVKNESHAAAHAGSEVASCRADHDDRPAGHVLAAVITDALDHRTPVAVTNRETLATHPADVRLAARRPVQGDVSDDDVVLRDERRVIGRHDHDPPATEPLGKVIVCIAFQPERHPGGEKRAKALTGGTLECVPNRVVRKSSYTVLASDQAAHHRPYDPVRVSDREHRLHRRLILQRRGCALDQLVIQRRVEAVVLLLAVVDGHALGRLGLVEQIA